MLIAFSSTVLLAVPAGASDEGEFPLFVVLAILAPLAGMAVVAAHHRADNPDESPTRTDTKPQPESLGPPPRSNRHLLTGDPGAWAAVGLE
ncbi:hypothetical protein CA951_07035 [Rhodococcus sp. NCIMB 12038]|nr:hypothetical protein CA951_07035 [Rhodococcus sp. NCIMB 12038]